MQSKHHTVDFCVVGGGLAGLCAAVAAAREGVRVALIQDRPVLGGNASSEIRMWVCGAHGENNRETGIIEEIKLQNRAMNPLGVFSIWDAILYEKARFEPNILLLLNCSVCDCEVADRRIKSVKAWQLTTYTWHTVEAGIFADCSGDSILAPLSGAEFRVGREGRKEFDESIAPERSDERTMGMSCLIQARETKKKHRFTPPEWAYRYDGDGSLPDRNHSLRGTQNFWWLEVGGMDDSIHDTEELRDELLKIAFGVWDHIKNRDDHEADTWVLDWVGFLPGKRESRRYVGDHVLNQRDIEGEGRHFEDIVAYGGWTMDDHFPEGFYKKEAGTIFHPAPSPYGIPFRSLYSNTIVNLMFAGRNISATHTALSSTRVMATCSVIGQAVGTAAAIAVAGGFSPRGVYERALGPLKQRLMETDCYLPFTKREMTGLTARAKLSPIPPDSGFAPRERRDTIDGEIEALRNGFDRPIGKNDNGFYCALGGGIEYLLDRPERVESIRLVFDSDLRDERAGHMPSYYELGPEAGESPRVTPVPESMTKRYKLETRNPDGVWEEMISVDDNAQRLNLVHVDGSISGVRFSPLETYGSNAAHLFAFDLL